MTVSDISTPLVWDRHCPLPHRARPLFFVDTRRMVPGNPYPGKTNCNRAPTAS
ncbi:hypothetical protein [Paractinoplanes deccanensis]|uniref:hypothetical protein n=1 Tax=Paractinoplanes deccanensis TaxID=113561 RepID=UPI001945B258|nr:hypothetical protein [Actinoplanes deccanensis]